MSLIIDFSGTSRPDDARPGATLEEFELRHWIGERVEKFKRPDAVHFGEVLPLGRPGQVDRGALRHAILAAGGTVNRWSRARENANGLSKQRSGGSTGAGDLGQ